MNITQRSKSVMASLVLAITFSVTTHAQEEQGNQQLMNLVLQMQQLQDEIRAMRGQLEEQSYELENLKNRQRDQYLDLDQRISEIRDGRPAMSGGPTVATQGNPAVTSSGASAVPSVTSSTAATDTPDITDRSGSASAVTGLAAPATQSQSAQATPEMEQAAYDQAFQALKELRYADAAEEFQGFLQQYPDSDLADNAQYWLGESYYVTRNYEIALDTFKQLMSQYPTSGKAGDGLLKIGFTHYELQQWDEARSALEQVQRQYPNSTLSRLAESRLRSMRLEGHL